MCQAMQTCGDGPGCRNSVVSSPLNARVRPHCGIQTRVKLPTKLADGHCRFPARILGIFRFADCGFAQKRGLTSWPLHSDAMSVRAP